MVALSGTVPGFETLAGYSFRRYVHRAILLLALVGLWPFARALGVRAWRDLGLERSGSPLHGLLLGAAVGIGVLALGSAVMLGAGARVLATEATAARVAGGLVLAVLSASVVALIEEVLFRGVLFGALARAGGWRSALVLSSLVYALVHFFGAPPSPSPIVWSSGLAILPGMVAGFVRVEEMVPAFLSLTVAGAALALSVRRTRGLAFAIGLHAGWVFWVQVFALLTDEAAGAARGLWGSEILIDGWLAFAVLSVTLAGVWVWLPGAPRAAPSRASGDRH